LEEDKSTLETMDSLGTVLWKQDKQQEFEALSRRAFNIRVQVKGEEDFSTLRSRGNIILSMQKQNKAGVKKLYEDHRARYDRIARTSFEKGDFSKAAEFFEQGYWVSYVCEDNYGWGRETMTLRSNWAISVEKDGRDEEAEKLLREMLQETETKLGRMHAETQYLMVYLTNFLETRGRSEEMVELWNNIFGGKHEWTRRNIVSLRLKPGPDALREPVKFSEARSIIP